MKYSSTSPSSRPPRGIDGAAGARAHQPHFQHVGFDDGADIHAVALRDARMGDAPAAVLALPDFGEALVGLERIAAGGDEIDRGVEIGARERRIRRGGAHFGVKLVGQKRRADSAAEDVLRQNVERAGAQRRRVLRVLGHRVDGGAAFQHLEAVGRHQHGFGRLVEPVIGAADALHQPRGALRRADIDDQIDVAPVDAEIERRRAHHRAQFAGGHGVLDLAALGDVERAVMQGDGEIVVVDAPQFLEHEFGLAARVDEDQRGLVALDQIVDFAERMPRRMAGPGQMLLGVEHGDLRLRAGLRHDDIGARRRRRRLRHQKAGRDRRARRPSPKGRPW